ncbi:MAG TPA: histidine kinase [Marmoricola sp.]|nr:histidine kinase [Marmoricola sp.]
MRTSPAVVAGAATALAVAGLAVVTADGAWDLAAADQLLVDATVGTTCSLMGAVILLGARRRRSARPLGWVLLLSGTASALAVVTRALVIVAPEPTPTVEALAQLQSWVWVPGFAPLLTLVPLLYPDGLLPGRPWRAAAGGAVAGIVLVSAGVGLYPEALTGRTTVHKPVTSQGVATVLTGAGGALLLVALLAGLIGLGLRLRRVGGMQRRQVLLLLLAAGALLVVTLLQGSMAAMAAAAAQAVAAALIPVAIAVAVTRDGLYEVDLALRRGLVAVSLAVCLAGGYLTLFSVLGTVLPDAAWSGAVAAGAVGVAVQPLAVRLTRGVDRLYYGDRADPYAVATRLSARLAAAGLDVAAVPVTVCETLVDSLRLSSAGLVLDVDGGERTVAAVGTPTGRPSELELRHRGHRVGRLVVTPRPGEEVVDPRDLELLAVLADQAAPAMSTVRLHEHLQQSREALVLAREEERRRLRRDLHDGVGATLAGVRLQVESARDLVADASAGRLLDAATEGIAHAVQDVRHVTDDLRPPALDEVGLATALRLLADRLRTPSLDVRAEVEELSPMPAAIEVAGYRIASEAVANAVKHSAGTSVLLSAATDEAALVVRVVDDGVGLDGAPSRRGSGLGLTSIRQRAEELGGSLSIGSGAGGRGTAVHAVLPWEERA